MRLIEVRNRLKIITTVFVLTTLLLLQNYSMISINPINNFDSNDKASSFQNQSNQRNTFDNIKSLIDSLAKLENDGKKGDRNSQDSISDSGMNLNSKNELHFEKDPVFPTKLSLNNTETFWRSTTTISADLDVLNPGLTYRNFSNNYPGNLVNGFWSEGRIGDTVSGDDTRTFEISLSDSTEGPFETIETNDFDWMSGSVYDWTLYYELDSDEVIFKIEDQIVSHYSVANLEEFDTVVLNTHAQNDSSLRVDNLLLNNKTTSLSVEASSVTGETNILEFTTGSVLTEGLNLTGTAVMDWSEWSDSDVPQDSDITFQIGLGTNTHQKPIRNLPIEFFIYLPWSGDGAEPEDYSGWELLGVSYTDSLGVAELDVYADFPAGTYATKAEFSGTRLFGSSATFPKENGLIINPVSSTTTIEKLNQVNFTDQTLIQTYTKDVYNQSAPGVMSFEIFDMDNISVYQESVKMVSGFANLDFTANLKPGLYTLETKYSGNRNITSSEAVGLLTIGIEGTDFVTEGILQNSPIETTYGASETFVLKLVDDENIPISNQPIEFKILNDTGVFLETTVQTNQNGYALLTQVLDLGIGLFDLQIVFENSTYFYSQTIENVINIAKVDLSLEITDFNIQYTDEPSFNLNLRAQNGYNFESLPLEFVLYYIYNDTFDESSLLSNVNFTEGTGNFVYTAPVTIDFINDLVSQYQINEGRYWNAFFLQRNFTVSNEIIRLGLSDNIYQEDYASDLTIETMLSEDDPITTVPSINFGFDIWYSNATGEYEVGYGVSDENGTTLLEVTTDFAPPESQYTLKINSSAANGYTFFDDEILVYLENILLLRNTTNSITTPYKSPINLNITVEDFFGGSYSDVNITALIKLTNTTSGNLYDLVLFNTISNTPTTTVEFDLPSNIIPDSYELIIRYEQPEFQNTYQSSINLNVTKKETTLTSEDYYETLWSQRIDLQTLLKTSTGDPINNTKIEYAIFFDGKWNLLGTSKSNGNGNSTFRYNTIVSEEPLQYLTSGNYSLLANFTGSARYSSSITTFTLEIKPVSTNIDVIVGSPRYKDPNTRLDILVTDQFDRPVTNQQVRIDFPNVNLNITEITDGEGKIVYYLPIFDITSESPYTRLDVGMYNFTVGFEGNTQKYLRLDTIEQVEIKPALIDITYDLRVDGDVVEFTVKNTTHSDGYIRNLPVEFSVQLREWITLLNTSEIAQSLDEFINEKVSNSIGLIQDTSGFTIPDSLSPGSDSPPTLSVSISSFDDVFSDDDIPGFTLEANDDNTVTKVEYRYKETDGGSFTSWTSIQLAYDNIYQIAFELGATDRGIIQVISPLTSVNMEYDFEFRVTDSSGQINSAPITKVICYGNCQGDRELPSSVTITDGSASGTSVTLEWTEATDNVGIAEYKISTAGGVIQYDTGTATTQFTIHQLAPETTYNFRVQAIDTNDNLGPKSNSYSVTTEQSGDDPCNETPTPRGCGTDPVISSIEDNTEDQFCIGDECRLIENTGETTTIFASSEVPTAVIYSTINFNVSYKVGFTDPTIDNLVSSYVGEDVSLSRTYQDPYADIPDLNGLLSDLFDVSLNKEVVDVFNLIFADIIDGSEEIVYVPGEGVGIVSSTGTIREVLDEFDYKWIRNSLSMDLGTLNGLFYITNYNLESTEWESLWETFSTTDVSDWIQISDFTDSSGYDYTSSALQWQNEFLNWASKQNKFDDSTSDVTKLDYYFEHRWMIGVFYAFKNYLEENGNVDFTNSISTLRTTLQSIQNYGKSILKIKNLLVKGELIELFYDSTFSALLDTLSSILSVAITTQDFSEVTDDEGKIRIDIREYIFSTLTDYLVVGRENGYTNLTEAIGGNLEAVRIVIDFFEFYNQSASLEQLLQDTTDWFRSFTDFAFLFNITDPNYGAYVDAKYGPQIFTVSGRTAQRYISPAFIDFEKDQWEVSNQFFLNVPKAALQTYRIHIDDLKSFNLADTDQSLDGKLEVPQNALQSITVYRKIGDTYLKLTTLDTSFSYNDDNDDDVQLNTTEFQSNNGASRFMFAYPDYNPFTDMFDYLTSKFKDNNALGVGTVTFESSSGEGIVINKDKVNLNPRLFKSSSTSIFNNLEASNSTFSYPLNLEELGVGSHEFMFEYSYPLPNTGGSTITLQSHTNVIVNSGVTLETSATSAGDGKYEVTIKALDDLGRPAKNVPIEVTIQGSKFAGKTNSLGVANFYWKPPYLANFNAIAITRNSNPYLEAGVTKSFVIEDEIVGAFSNFINGSVDKLETAFKDMTGIDISGVEVGGTSITSILADVISGSVNTAGLLAIQPLHIFTGHLNRWVYPTSNGIEIGEIGLEGGTIPIIELLDKIKPFGLSGSELNVGGILTDIKINIDPIDVYKYIPYMNSNGYIEFPITSKYSLKFKPDAFNIPGLPLRYENGKLIIEEFENPIYTAINGLSNIPSLTKNGYFNLNELTDFVDLYDGTDDNKLHIPAWTSIPVLSSSIKLPFDINIGLPDLPSVKIPDPLETYLPFDFNLNGKIDFQIPNPNLFASLLGFETEFGGGFESDEPFINILDLLADPDVENNELNLRLPYLKVTKTPMWRVNIDPNSDEEIGQMTGVGQFAGSTTSVTGYIFDLFGDLIDNFQEFILDKFGVIILDIFDDILNDPDLDVLVSDSVTEITTLFNQNLVEGGGARTQIFGFVEYVYAEVSKLDLSGILSTFELITNRLPLDALTNLETTISNLFGDMFKSLQNGFKLLTNIVQTFGTIGYDLIVRTFDIIISSLIDPLLDQLTSYIEGLPEYSSLLDFLETSFNTIIGLLDNTVEINLPNIDTSAGVFSFLNNLMDLIPLLLSTGNVLNDESSINVIKNITHDLLSHIMNILTSSNGFLETFLDPSIRLSLLLQGFLGSQDQSVSALGSDIIDSLSYDLTSFTDQLEIFNLITSDDFTDVGMMTLLSLVMVGVQFIWLELTSLRSGALEKQRFIFQIGRMLVSGVMYGLNYLYESIAKDIVPMFYEERFTLNFELDPLEDFVNQYLSFLTPTATNLVLNFVSMAISLLYDIGFIFGSKDSSDNWGLAVKIWITFMRFLSLLFILTTLAKLGAFFVQLIQLVSLSLDVFIVLSKIIETVFIFILIILVTVVYFRSWYSIISNGNDWESIENFYQKWIKQKKILTVLGFAAGLSHYGVEIVVGLGLEVIG